MRVTNQILFKQTQSEIQKTSQRVAHLQEAITTGKRINHFGDDPIGAVRALDLRVFEASLVQYNKNVNAGLPFLEQTDSVLGEVKDALDRAKELAIQLTNDSNNAGDRQIAALEVQQIFERIVGLANSQVEGRYLFGGFKNGSAPFSASGAYVGDNGEIAVQTSASSSVALNIPGNKVFQGANTSGGVGILDIVRDLKAVFAGNGSGVDPLAVSMSLNLDASATAPGSAFPAGPDDTLANWEAGSNFSTTAPLFDSLGTGHEVRFLFRQTGATTWDYRAIAKQSEVDANAPSSTNWREVSNGTLTFDGLGAFNAAGSTINAVGPLTWVNGSASQTIAASDLSFAGSTQLNEPSTVLTLTQTNVASFATEIGRLDAAIEHLAGIRAEVGARINTANTAKESVGVLQMQTQIRRGEIEGADAYQIYSDFSRAMSAFEAALQSSARITQISLLDFLR
ncbi:MAG: flagellar hook-associated protein FlgL [Candidatus Binatia bacterium]